MTVMSGFEKSSKRFSCKPNSLDQSHLAQRDALNFKIAWISPGSVHICCFFTALPRNVWSIVLSCGAWYSMWVPQAKRDSLTGLTGVGFKCHDPTTCQGLQYPKWSDWSSSWRCFYCPIWNSLVALLEAHLDRRLTGSGLLVGVTPGLNKISEP